jgi:hypothetical protein
VCSALIGRNTATLSADDLNTVDSDLLTCAEQSLQDIASSLRKGNGGGDQEESEEDDDDATSSGISEPKQRTVSDAREAIATLTDFLLTHTLTSPDEVLRFRISQNSYMAKWFYRSLEIRHKRSALYHILVTV